MTRGKWYGMKEVGCRRETSDKEPRSGTVLKKRSGSKDKRALLRLGEYLPREIGTKSQ